MIALGSYTEVCGYIGHIWASSVLYECSNNEIRAFFLHEFCLLFSIIFTFLLIKTQFSLQVCKSLPCINSFSRRCARCWFRMRAYRSQEKFGSGTFKFHPSCNLDFFAIAEDLFLYLKKNENLNFFKEGGGSMIFYY